jgi:hypothetical protein
MPVSEPPVDANAPLAAQRMAIGLAVDVQRLNALDDVWTAYLDAEPEPVEVERDLPALRGLVEDICGLIDGVARGCGELRGTIREVDADLDEELRRVLAQEPVGEGLLATLPDAPFAEQVVEACSIVEAEAGTEIDAFQRKLHQLAESGFAPGDMGGRLKCAILLVGAGASLVGLILTPAGVIPGTVVAGAGILISTLASARGWNCKRAGDIAAATG